MNKNHYNEFLRLTFYVIQINLLWSRLEEGIFASLINQ